MKNLLILIFSFLISCTSVLAKTPTEILGFWEMVGYGKIAHITKDKVLMYDTTAISCLESDEYPIAMLSSDYTLNGNELTLRVGITQFVLNKIEELPPLCTKKLSKKERKDPFYNFEVLWNTFNDQYLYFNERNVDWAVSYNTYRKQITQETSQEELYVILYQMVADLNDGHASIDADDKILKNVASQLPKIAEDDIDLKTVASTVVDTYLKNPKAHNFSKTVWGKISDDVGYFQVNDMVAQANYGITPEMSKKEATKIYMKAIYNSTNSMKDEVDGMHETMVKIMEDFKDTQAVILDVRFNGGGYDAVAFEILRFFTGEPYVAFSKYARKGGTTTTPFTYTVQPIAGYGEKKLYILQSNYSASAVETMLLASLQMPNVTRLGASSEGIFSDSLDKVLPNGWNFSLSNEAYTTPEGINYEGKGITPDIPFEYPTNDDAFVSYFMKEVPLKGDTAIEYVLEKENKK